MLSESIRDFRWEIKISHLARLFQIVTDVYGIPKIMHKMHTMEGMEVMASFPKMNNLFATIKISNCKFYPRMGKSENAIATVAFNMDAEEIIPIINDVIRTNATIGGLAKLAFKYMLPRKIILKGSLFRAVQFIKCLMLGRHFMFQDEVE